MRPAMKPRVRPVCGQRCGGLCGQCAANVRGVVRPRALTGACSGGVGTLGGKGPATILFFEEQADVHAPALALICALAGAMPAKKFAPSLCEKRPPPLHRRRQRKKVRRPPPPRCQRKISADPPFPPSPLDASDPERATPRRVG